VSVEMDVEVGLIGDILAKLLFKADPLSTILAEARFGMRDGRRVGCV
jgi:hypothetical protein